MAGGEFPNLSKPSEGMEITSPKDAHYNCIGWAADDKVLRFWWPTTLYYWPRGVAREVSRDAFVAAFQTRGFEPCDDESLEDGYIKIALYEQGGEPTHAARQLPDGRWTSKLGKNHDITHNTVRGVEGPLYGRAVLYMRRPIAPAAPPVSPTSTLHATDGHDVDDGPAPDGS
jgi:hypothetical protein